MPPDHASKRLTAGKKKGCPVCGKPVVATAKPFCSERCRDVDLGRWLSGSYVIQGREDDEDTDAASQD
jgi:endogenous inhibitor of DNA gyrase (YacG/DUF329 family)